MDTKQDTEQEYTLLPDESIVLKGEGFPIELKKNPTLLIWINPATSLDWSALSSPGMALSTKMTVTQQRNTARESHFMTALNVWNLLPFSIVFSSIVAKTETTWEDDGRRHFAFRIL